MRRISTVIDLVIVVLFVSIGRSVHDHGVSLAGLTSTAWPFVAGLIIGWLIVMIRRRSGVAPLDGLIVSLATVSVGMILRVISGQGTAAAFILVALAFLGAMMIGWRVVLAGFRRSRSAGGAA